MEFHVVCGVPAINAVDGKLDKYLQRYVLKFKVPVYRRNAVVLVKQSSFNHALVSGGAV